MEEVALDSLRLDAAVKLAWEALVAKVVKAGVFEGISLDELVDEQAFILPNGNLLIKAGVPGKVEIGLELPFQAWELKEGK